MGEWNRESGGKGTGNKKHKWKVQNRQGEVKNIMGNGEVKELIYPWTLTKGEGCWREGGQRKIKERKNGTTVIA